MTPPGGERTGGFAEVALRVVLVLFAFALPLSIALLTVLLVAGLALWGLCALRGRARWVRSPLHLPAAVFALVLVVSALASPRRDLTLRRHALGQYWSMAALPWVGALAGPVDRVAMVRSVGVGAGLNGLYATVQHFTGWDLFRRRGAEKASPAPEGKGWIGKGTFSHHLIFADALLCALGLMAGRWLVTAGPERWVFGIEGLFVLLGLGFSFARSAWAGLLASAAVLAAAGLKAEAPGVRRRVLALLAGVAAVGLLAAAADPALWVRAERAFDPRASAERRVVWRGALDLWERRPWLGFGPGTFRAEMGLLNDRWGTGLPDWSMAHAHDNFLTVLAETGIAGLAAFLWLWGTAFATAFRSLRTGGGMEAGVLASLAGFFVLGLFQTNLTDAVGAFWLWTLLALARKPST